MYQSGIGIRLGITSSTYETGIGIRLVLPKLIYQTSRVLATYQSRFLIPILISGPGLYITPTLEKFTKLIANKREFFFVDKLFSERNLEFFF
jgi:hypothetical protein